MADLEVVEQALDAIEDQIDGIVDVVEVVRNNPVALVAAGVVGAAVGLVGGYFLSRKILGAEFAQLAEQEIADAKVFYAELNKVNEDGTPLSPQDVMEKLHGSEAMEAIRTYQGDDPEGYPEGTPHDNVLDEEVLSSMEDRIREEKNEAAAEAVAEEESNVKTPYRNAFRGGKPRDSVNMFADDTFDPEEEEKLRTEDRPYVITHDEFFAAERDFENHSYTFYEVDGVLTDEHDKPIEATDEIVGDENLLRFGSGSKDPNIVYVRHERMGVDMEVIRSKGSYLEEVLGIPKDDDNSLKHSNRDVVLNRRRAFRHGDG